jgi:hypothetical protein
MQRVPRVARNPALPRSLPYDPLAFDPRLEAHNTSRTANPSRRAYPVWTAGERPFSFFAQPIIQLFDVSERRPVDTVAHTEMVEGGIDAFIAKRDEQRRKEEGRPAEELYADSCRRHQERQQLQRWWEALRYHERMVRAHTATLEALIANHRKEAERYAALLGVESIDETIKVNGHKKGRAA